MERFRARAPSVILSAAKDLHFWSAAKCRSFAALRITKGGDASARADLHRGRGGVRRSRILRCAQDDKGARGRHPFARATETRRAETPQARNEPRRLGSRSE